MSETPAALPTITVENDLRDSTGPIVPESPVQLTPPCSAHTCAKGHVWPVLLGTAPCGGCKAVVAVIKLTNCPICNEPIASTRLRIEHTTASVGVIALCQGLESPAHSQTAHIDLTALAVGPTKPEESKPGESTHDQEAT